VVADAESALVGQRIKVATALFSAWSGSDLDGPRRYFAEDGVLFDIIGGEYRGWPAIRAYFGHGRQRYPDLVLEPTGDFWSRPDGLAMLWTMSATQTADNLGPKLLGRRWTVEGMSYLVSTSRTVVREADYHDRGSRERSSFCLTLPPGRPRPSARSGCRLTARLRKRRCTATPMAADPVGGAVRRKTSSAVRFTQAPSPS
jgi:hypothetical protein